MRDLGFDEIVGWSFTDPGEAGRLRIPDGDPRAGAVVISNPLSEEQSVMRTTLLGSLLDVARGNLARGAERVALFESGRVYLPPDGGRRRAARRRLPGRAAGAVRTSRTASAASRSARSARPPGGARATAADFFALKGVLEGARRAARRRARVRGPRASRSCIPAAAAEVLVEGAVAGWVGEVHPLVCRAWDVDAAAGFEVDLAPLVAASPAWQEEFEDLTTHPAVHQDLAVVVEDSVPAAEVASRGARRRAASCFARPRSSTSTRASSSARVARAWRCGSSSAPPTGP